MLLLQVKEDEISGACNTYGEMINAYKILVRKPDNRHKENNIKIDIKEIRCKARFSNELMGTWSFRFHKRIRISWPLELLMRASAPRKYLIIILTSSHLKINRITSQNVVVFHVYLRQWTCPMYITVMSKPSQNSFCCTITRMKFTVFRSVALNLLDHNCSYSQ